MEPMKPMEPMRPMEPMKPMEPMRFEQWWPDGLGQPATSGGSNGLRYAFFPESRRLIVERGGRRTTYDTGSHRIGGVQSQQQNGGEPSLSFSSQHGPVRLDELRQVDEAPGHGGDDHGEHRAAPGATRRQAHERSVHDEPAEPARRQRPPESHHPVHGETASGAEAGERVVFSEDGGTAHVKLVVRGTLDLDAIEAVEDFLRRQKRRLARA